MYKIFTYTRLAKIIIYCSVKNNLYGVICIHQRNICFWKYTALIPIGYCSSCASNMPGFNPLSLSPSVVLRQSSRVVPIDMVIIIPCMFCQSRYISFSQAYTCHMFLLSCLHCSARFTYVDRITISTWNSIHYTPVMLNQPSETGGRIVFKVSEIHAGESEDDLRQ